MKRTEFLCEKIRQKVKPISIKQRKTGYPHWTQCHRWPSGLVTDAEGHMTPPHFGPR